MQKAEAKKRAEKLKAEINELRYRYHVLDDPKISDEVYQSLTSELVKIEREFPELVTSDSPTQRIGGAPLDKFEKAEHVQPMLSLNDAFDEEEVKAWEDRLSRLEPDLNWSYFCELKYDGLAISLTYQDMFLEVGATRGDGKIGEDVTNNIKTIQSIPLTLNTDLQYTKNQNHDLAKRVKDKLENTKTIIVRGEAIMSKVNFQELNKVRKKNGETEFANPRNASAGAIRQLDPKITAGRKLDFIAYSLVTDLGQKTHEEEHQICQMFGFKTSGVEKSAKNLQQVFDFQKQVNQDRESYKYEIDGVVVQVNENEVYKRMGVVGKAPRGSVAFKFAGKTATTKVVDVEIQVGRTGKLTPVAELEPVDLGGVVISRASLHNFDEIERLDLRIGDTVVVNRAGDVIPQIVEVFPKLRDGNEKKVKIPKTCPICQGEVKKDEEKVDYFCQNPDCFVKTQRGIKHFVSKNAFDIEGLGPKILEQFMNEGLISDASDLYDLRPGDIKVLERFAEKSAENIYNSIQNSKSITLPRFIYALGIKHVGEETSIALAEHFASLDKLMEAGPEKLESIEDIGGVVAYSIYEYFHSSQNKQFIDRLLEKGVRVKSYKTESKSQKLKGLKIIVTGTLQSMSREQAKQTIRNNGGDFVSAVSKNIDLIVVGENPGDSKLKKANNFGIKTLKEAEFLKLIN